MRILTWNINGVRTIPQYHPWNTLSSFTDILDALAADIICFQEMKSSRSGLTRQMAIPSSYDAFFSFPIKKSGYSGVAIYTRTDLVVPLRAEEGLCSIVQMKSSLAPEERVSNAEAYAPSVMEEADDDTGDVDFKGLDSEGRAVVVDLGLFVLINVYCPNDSNDTKGRDKYKIDFHRILESRVKGLIEKEKREVMVVGDLNACAAVIDHCEGHIMVAKGIAQGLQGEEGFWGQEFRQQMRNWLIKNDGTGGCMVDVVRRFWPDRKGMYTCWNTKISARETNYGTRIDYILVTQGLLSWVKAADIQPHIKGSDHCPVYVDLHEEITQADGTVTKLRDVLGLKPGATVREPPRLASRFWAEYSGKQMLLDKFFNRSASLVQSTSEIFDSGSLATPPSCSYSGLDLPSLNEPTTPLFDLSEGIAPPSSPAAESTPPTSQSPIVSAHEPRSSMPGKRKLTVDTLARGSKKSKKERVPETKVEQMKLSTFFAKPELATESSQTSGTGPLQCEPASLTIGVEDLPLLGDLPFAEMDITQTMVSDPSIHRGTTQTKEAWSNLLAPIQTPNCLVHGEPAKEFTVNKAGPNKGKKFFVCSRPVGPGYDKGKAERLQEHVDPRWKCDFFKWAKDVRKEMRKG